MSDGAKIAFKVLAGKIDDFFHLKKNLVETLNGTNS